MFKDRRDKKRETALIEEFLYRLGAKEIETPEQVSDFYEGEEIALLSNVLQPWFDGIKDREEHVGDEIKEEPVNLDKVLLAIKNISDLGGHVDFKEEPAFLKDAKVSTISLFGLNRHETLIFNSQVERYGQGIKKRKDK